MQRLFLHAGFIIASLILTFSVKNLNPQELDHQLELATTIDCIEANLSGIAFNKQTKTFFVISNGPEKLVEISATGECLASYPLHEFEDTEDVFHIKEDSFLIVEERKRAINYVQIDDNQITKSQTLILIMDGASNKGLEGVVYSPSTDSVYVVNEMPQQIIRIPNSKHTSERIEMLDSFWARALMDDYSSITDTGDGLLLLSHESNRLLKLSYQGAVEASLDLTSDHQAGQSEVQPEGVAVDDQNNIYIVSEPNHLNVYTKKPATDAGFLVFALND